MLVDCYDCTIMVCHYYMPYKYYTLKLRGSDSTGCSHNGVSRTLSLPLLRRSFKTVSPRLLLRTASALAMASCPWLSFIVMSAPSSTSERTQSTWPLVTAIWRGVNPPFACTLGLKLCKSNNCTMSAWLESTASCNIVTPLGVA